MLAGAKLCKGGCLVVYAIHRVLYFLMVKKGLDQGVNRVGHRREILYKSNYQNDGTVKMFFTPEVRVDGQ